MTMLFDTHAHLDDHAFDPDRDALLAALPGQGIGLLMNPGCSLATSRAACALAREHSWIYAAVGSHPDAAAEVTPEVLEEYRRLIRGNPKVKAIGEIGLDYHYEDVPRNIQQEAFLAQMELAREAKLPVIVHERDAHADGMTVVRQFPEVTGVFHCYSGSLEMARELVEQGWYIGFTGVLTFKNVRRALEVAAGLPLDRIVLETDCPYLSPVPNRGKRNSSLNLPYVVDMIAELKGITTEEVMEKTWENAKALYRMIE